MIITPPHTTIKPMMRMKVNRRNVMQKSIKRLFDIVASSVLIICIFPLWIVIAVAIYMTSPGGVFFVQRRTGYMGKEFSCLKFRTMYLNGESDTLQATAADPRITLVGAFLRKTSLDETPQLLNVLVGNMSLVGPRPHMVKHTEMYSGAIMHYMDRHLMRPGLTGYAQIKGFRGETPDLQHMLDRVKADLVYVRHFSLCLDIKILWITMIRILTLKL